MDASIKRGRKFEVVIAGARRIFLRDGFDGASVDEIAASAGVSKATLYSYFPDKRLLFLEVARQEINAITDRASQGIDRSAPPPVVLSEVARTIIGFATSPVGIGIFRLCVAEAERFPELGRAYYDSGPDLARRELCAYLAEARSRGELIIQDLDLASKQFMELCRTDLQLKLLMGVPVTLSLEAIEGIAQGATELFLARYGA